MIDNLRAAVTKADWYEPELHPKLRSFCEHYGVVILPTRPYMPRHKGKIESGVKYVKRNALKARQFASLEEENEFLLRWETTVADTRIHGTTKQQVGKLFESVERAALSPLPLERFPFFHERQRTVHRDGHVQVDGGVLLGSARVPRPGRCGCAGTAAWCGSSISSWSRSAFTSSNRREAASAPIPPTSHPRRSAAWNGAPNGCCGVPARSASTPIAGPRR